MSVTIDGTLGVTTPAESVTGTGVWSVGSTQIYKDASGNVGIGTSSPLGTSAGRGNLTINGSTDAILSFGNANSLAGYILQDSGGMTINATGAVYQRFFTNGSERARIDSSGNLLVGTTTTTAGQVGHTIVLNGTATALNTFHGNGVATGNAYHAFYYNAGAIGSITQNGTTGVLYNLTSDYRLKNDPQPLTGAKEFVMALQPKKWQWWDGSGEGVGFIAHEFMEVAKHSGNGEKDAVDADGNPVYQSIQPSSSEVMANLVSLLQEQQAIITQLQADVAALKAK